MSVQGVLLVYGKPKEGLIQVGLDTRPNPMEDANIDMEILFAKQVLIEASNHHRTVLVMSYLNYLCESLQGADHLSVLYESIIKLAVEDLAVTNPVQSTIMSVDL